MEYKYFSLYLDTLDFLVTELNEYYTNLLIETQGPNYKAKIMQKKNNPFPFLYISRGIDKEALQDYFFFDGARLSEYFQKNKTKQIRKAVFSLSQLNLLESTSQNMLKVRRQYVDKQKLDSKDLGYIIHEKNYMKLIKHPNIVSLIEDFENEKYIYLVMEYYKGGDLFSYIYEYYKNKKMISEKNVAKIIKIIAQCVQYLNYFGIVHRDLKPENIVFGENDNINSLTIIDLGVAITLSEGQTSTVHLGTLEYISPEILTGKPYGKGVDVWSIGIILYNLLTLGSIFPFDCDSKDKKERDENIGKKIVFLQQEYPKEFFGNKSKYLISLIDRALEKSPEKRITIDDFLNNFWLVNNSK